MDIEKRRREELVSLLSDSFFCIEECRVTLVGFCEDLRIDVAAFSKSKAEPWVLAFEVKEPTRKWELKNWLNLIRQAGNYPNCRVSDERAGSFSGRLINASFIYPSPDFSNWTASDSQANRFYREHDAQPIRGAILLAQHFKVGTAYLNQSKKLISLKLGTDPVWNNSQGFRSKSKSLLENRRIGSVRRNVHSK